MPRWPATSAVAAPSRGSSCIKQAAEQPQQLDQSRPDLSRAELRHVHFANDRRSKRDAMSRRAFLKASLRSAALSCSAFISRWRAPRPATQKQEAVRSERIHPHRPQGAVTFIIPQAEMGQGVYTSIAMILAEELDVAWEQVQVEAAPPSDKLYGNPTFGLQVTGNSNSIRAFWMSLRKAGAGARAMLVERRLRRWRVDAGRCRAENGEVIQMRRAAEARLRRSHRRREPAREPPKDPPLRRQPISGRSESR